jgi:hypothetical protein
MMRDELFVFPVTIKLGKKFREGRFACFKTKRVKKGKNCIGCFSAALCPFPGVCMLQACTILEIEEVLRSISGHPLTERNEKQGLLLKHFLIGCLGCCVGQALNRSKIAAGVGVDEHCGIDCLLNMCCLCQCLAIQEFYSINEMRNPTDDPA